jgi:hypothetical protein
MVACGVGKPSQMIDADCKAHLIIERAEAKTNDRGTTVEIKFNLLAATDPSQVGKSLTEFFQTDGGAVDKLYNVAEAVGLITHDQRKAAAEAGVGMNIDEMAMKGRQLCGEIKMELNQRKNPATGQLETDPEKPGPFPRVGFRTFALTSPKAKDIPKDPQFLAMLGKQPPPAPPTAGTTVPNQPPPPVQPVQGLSMSW